MKNYAYKKANKNLILWTLLLIWWCLSWLSFLRYAHWLYFVHDFQCWPEFHAHGADQMVFFQQKQSLAVDFLQFEVFGIIGAAGKILDEIADLRDAPFQHNVFFDRWQITFSFEFRLLARSVWSWDFVVTVANGDVWRINWRIFRRFSADEGAETLFLEFSSHFLLPAVLAWNQVCAELRRRRRNNVWSCSRFAVCPRSVTFGFLDGLLFLRRLVILLLRISLSSDWKRLVRLLNHISFDDVRQNVRLDHRLWQFIFQHRNICACIACALFRVTFSILRRKWWIYGRSFCGRSWSARCGLTFIDTGWHWRWVWRVTVSGLVGLFVVFSHLLFRLGLLWVFSLPLQWWHRHAHIDLLGVAISWVRFLLLNADSRHRRCWERRHGNQRILRWLEGRLRRRQWTKYCVRSVCTYGSRHWSHDLSVGHRRCHALWWRWLQLNHLTSFRHQTLLVDVWHCLLKAHARCDGHCRKLLLLKQNLLNISLLTHELVLRLLLNKLLLLVLLNQLSCNLLLVLAVYILLQDCLKFKSFVEKN